MGADRQRLKQAELAPFQTLVKLIEHELELAGQGRIEELQRAVAATGEYLLGLPNPPPAAALALIERARAMRARVTIETERLRDAIAATRATNRRRRRMARTYGAPPRSRYSASA